MVTSCRSVRTVFMPNLGTVLSTMANMRRQRVFIRTWTDLKDHIKSTCDTESHAVTASAHGGVMSVRSVPRPGISRPTSRPTGRYDVTPHRFLHITSSRVVFILPLDPSGDSRPQMCTSSPQICHSTMIRGFRAHGAKTNHIDGDHSRALVMRRQPPIFLHGSTPQAR